MYFLLLKKFPINCVLQYFNYYTARIYCYTVIEGATTYYMILFVWT